MKQDLSCLNIIILRKEIPLVTSNTISFLQTQIQLKTILLSSPAFSNFKPTEQFA